MARFHAYQNNLCFLELLMPNPNLISNVLLYENGGSYKKTTEVNNQGGKAMTSDVRQRTTAIWMIFYSANKRRDVFVWPMKMLLSFAYWRGLRGVR